MTKFSKGSGSQEDLINQLADLLDGVSFTPSDKFYWDCSSQTIYLDRDETNKNTFCGKLLHEAGHAKLNHRSYSSDLELIRMEAEAWRVGISLGKELGIKISMPKLNSSMGSYLDWAGARRVCPKCARSGIQSSGTRFACLSCANSWKVGTSRFKRLYRF